VSRFQFVADHQDAFEVKQLCMAVQIARSSFYAWQQAAAGRAERSAADAVLAQQIRAVHNDDKTYEAPRVTAELNDGAAPQDRVNHKRIARVMKQHRIAGVRLRRRVRTPSPRPATRRSPTCSSGTSPPQLRTAGTSVTSPTFHWPPARTCTWRPSSTATPDA